MITTESTLWEICYRMSEEMRGKWMCINMIRALRESQRLITRFLQYEDLENRRITYHQFHFLHSNYRLVIRKRHPEAAWLMSNTESAMRMEIEETEERNERENRHREHLIGNSK